jgi:CheY-like chemotaxis protein
MNILIIDGNDSDVDKTLKVFDRVRGSDSVYAVKDGQEALDFIYQNGHFNNGHKYFKPDLILLGANMHRAIGFVLQNELRSNGGKNIPVILPPLK